MGLSRGGRFPWWCPGCGKQMVLTGAQINAGKKHCTTQCPRTLEGKRMSTKTAFAATAHELIKHLDFGKISWRHHGLGMLQGELSEELRIHLWHPMLRTIPYEGKRDVHDHRFRIDSYIAYGSIVDVPHIVWFTKDTTATPGVRPSFPEFSERELYKLQPEQRWTLEDAWEIKHAKVQDGNDCKPLGKVWVWRGPEITRQQGQTYAIDRREFHTTVVTGFAITVVHRSEFDEQPARILGGCHSAINRDTPCETIGYVVDMAVGAQKEIQVW